MRGYLGTRFSHQGRDPKMTGLDCGGMILVGARQHQLSSLEFLGYALFPTEGKFDELLFEHADFIGEFAFPFNFTGDELREADLVSFDYGEGGGTRHIALVTGWDGRRYRILDALKEYGISEHALAAPFVKTNTVLKGWAVRGLDD